MLYHISGLFQAFLIGFGFPDRNAVSEIGFLNIILPDRGQFRPAQTGGETHQHQRTIPQPYRIIGKIQSADVTDRDRLLFDRCVPDSAFLQRESVSSP